MDYCQIKKENIIDTLDLGSFLENYCLTTIVGLDKNGVVRIMDKITGKDAYQKMQHEQKILEYMNKNDLAMLTKEEYERILKMTEDERKLFWIAARG